jgi:uncharacterized membrane protein YvbJ
MKKKLHFYCDHCGSEVPQNAKECPECGRSFASVRCPFCGFIGEGDLFKEGCPGCGYSAPGTSGTNAGEPLASPQPQKQKIASQASSIETLPLWVYIVTGLIFLGVLAVLYYSIN